MNNPNGFFPRVCGDFVRDVMKQRHGVREVCITQHFCQGVVIIGSPVVEIAHDQHIIFVSGERFYQGTQINGKLGTRVGWFMGLSQLGNLLNKSGSAVSISKRVFVHLTGRDNRERFFIFAGASGGRPAATGVGSGLYYVGH